MKNYKGQTLLEKVKYREYQDIVKILEAAMSNYVKLAKKEGTIIC